MDFDRPTLERKEAQVAFMVASLGPVIYIAQTLHPALKSFVQTRVAGAYPQITFWLSGSPD